MRLSVANASFSPWSDSSGALPNHPQSCWCEGRLASARQRYGSAASRPGRARDTGFFPRDRSRPRPGCPSRPLGTCSPMSSRRRVTNFPDPSARRSMQRSSGSAMCVRTGSRFPGDVRSAALSQQAGPVLLAIDDIQWIDPASAKVLSFAIRRLRTEPIGVLASLRVARARRIPSGFCGPPLNHRAGSSTWVPRRGVLESTPPPPARRRSPSHPDGSHPRGL